MKKIHIKLIAITLTLALAVTVMVMTSYAWFVLSGNPAVSGIQVAIGGGNTILVAADMTETVDGTTYHYPGIFSEKLHFNQHESYEYLNTLGGLTPVSTADGANWFLPVYYTTNDPEVRDGLVPNGQIREVEDFLLDYDMAHSNLDASDEDAIEEGSYVYLDFWVVSPSADFTLRLSTGDDSGGSFLIDLLQPVTNGTSYTLVEPENLGAAAARVGFLANADRIVDDTMLHYQDSYTFNQRYTELRGNYQQAGDGMDYTDNSRFTIYEPNGDYHPDNSGLAGCYAPTYPVTMIGGVPTATSALNRTTVQKASAWAGMTDGGTPAIEQIFQTALFGYDTENVDSATVAEHFYQGYLQGQIATYVDKGDFIKRSSDLASFAGTVSSEQFGGLDEAGATDDVYIIKLERNIPQRIRMFIWLEGQDIDCTDSVRSSNFALNIELAGSNE